jgi:hypothetical protein
LEDAAGNVKGSGGGGAGGGIAPASSLKGCGGGGGGGASTGAGGAGGGLEKKKKKKRGRILSTYAGGIGSTGSSEGLATTGSPTEGVEVDSDGCVQQ